jgi:signal peptidase II
VSDTAPPHEPEAPAAVPPAVARRIMRLGLVVAAVWFALDQVTKAWALEALDDGHIIDVVGSLRFRLTFNTGMSFGQGKGWGPVLSVVALVVVVVLLVSLRRQGSKVSALGVGLIVAGALGNVTDRVFRSDDGFLRGGVVDFIDLQWWPVFNVADIGITVGAVLLVLASLRTPRRAAPTDTIVGAP